MDITYNKVDQTALPISQDRVSASEYNQIAASLMHIINTAGLTPDVNDNGQLLNALGPRIVETYSNGTSWYRVYSDGWCEQGGSFMASSTTITFLQEFVNTNYNFISQASDINDYKIITSSWGNKTTSSIDVKNGVGGSAFSTLTNWRACGYIR